MRPTVSADRPYPYRPQMTLCQTSRRPPATKLAVDERRERTLGGPVSDEYDHSAYSGASSMVAPPLSIERHPFIVVRHGDGAGSAEQLKKSGKASEPFQSAWHRPSTISRHCCAGAAAAEDQLGSWCSGAERRSLPTGRPGAHGREVGKNALAATTFTETFCEARADGSGKP